MLVVSEAGGRERGTTGMGPAVDPVASLDVDDVAFCEMWHGNVPSLALRRGFSGLSVFFKGLYIPQISRLKTISNRPPAGASEIYVQSRCSPARLRGV